TGSEGEVRHYRHRRRAARSLAAREVHRRGDRPLGEAGQARGDRARVRATAETASAAAAITSAPANPPVAFTQYPASSGPRICPSANAEVIAAISARAWA